MNTREASVLCHLDYSAVGPGHGPPFRQLIDVWLLRSSVMSNVGKQVPLISDAVDQQLPAVSCCARRRNLVTLAHFRSLISVNVSSAVQ